MNDFNFICAFVIFCVISLSHSSSPPANTSSASNGLGIAVCNVYGQRSYACDVEDIPVDCFPKECTAFVYDGLDLTNLTVVDPTEKFRPDGYLDSLGSTNASVVVIYYHKSWHEAVKCIDTDGAETEVESWKAYLEKHPVITGLAIYGVEMTSDDEEDPQYSQNLKTYIDIMKTNFPDLKIGLALSQVAIYNNKDTPQMKWLDLACLDPSVDFYLVQSAMNFEIYHCTEEYKDGDIVANERIEAAREYLELFNTPKEKIVYHFNGQPTNVKFSPCDQTYSFKCLNPDSPFCAETQKKFFDKGKFCQEFASGFALDYIDVDDVYNCCQCERAFTIFYALLDGISGNPPPAECSLFDTHNF